MVRNEIYQLLTEMGKEYGWSEETKIVNLCGFINNLLSNMDIPTDFDPEEQLEIYLRNVVINERKDDGYCDECCIRHHDICSLTDGCPCCDDTKRIMLDEC